MNSFSCSTRGLMLGPSSADAPAALSTLLTAAAAALDRDDDW